MCIEYYNICPRLRVPRTMNFKRPRTFSDRCIEDVNATIDNLGNVNIPHYYIICKDVNCTNDAHISAINVLNSDLL